MSGRSDRVKAGLFVITCLAMFAALVVVVAGMRLAKKTKTLYVRFSESVTGLEPSSTVRYYGVPIGRVAHIGFASEAFPVIEVTIEVDPDAPIRRDTEAVLKAQGLTGMYYIDLEHGSDESRLLGERETIPARASVAVQLMDTLSALKQVIENLNGILSENREAIGSAVAKIDEVAESARAPVAKLSRAIDGIMDLSGDMRRELANASESVRETLDSVTEFVRSPGVQALPERVSGLLDRTDAVIEGLGSEVKSANLAGLMDRLGSALARLEDAAERLDLAVAEIHAGVRENRGSLGRILGDFRSFSMELRGLARELRGDPSRLVFPRRTPEKEEGR